MMPRLLRPLLMSLALLAAPAFATQYHVEVLVFRQSTSALPSTPAPEDWNSRTQTISAENTRTALYDTEIGRMQESGKYQILSRKAWLQQVTTDSPTISYSEGQLSDGHGQTDVLVRLTQKDDQAIELDLRAWANQFDANGFLTGSELLQQQRRLLPGQLIYIDHPTLGALVRVRQP